MRHFFCGKEGISSYARYWVRVLKRHSKWRQQRHLVKVAKRFPRTESWNAFNERKAENVTRLRKQREDRAKNVVRAPTVMCLETNIEEVMEFCNQIIEAIGDNRRIRITLEDVEVLTVPAIFTVLSAAWHYQKKKGTAAQLDLTVPRRPHLKKVLATSGASKYFRNARNFFPEIDPSSGRIEVLNREVRSNIIGQVYDMAADYFPDIDEQRKNDLYTLLGEAIYNACEHSVSGTADVGEWWLQSYFDKETNIMHISVIDHGVGILDSLKIKKAEAFIRFLRLKRNSDILLRVFKSETRDHTSTQLLNRGYGLHRIYTISNNGTFFNYIFMTKNVVISKDAPFSRTLGTSFAGTLYYWQYGKR